MPCWVEYFVLLWAHCTVTWEEQHTDVEVKTGNSNSSCWLLIRIILFTRNRSIYWIRLVSLCFSISWLQSSHNTCYIPINSCFNSYPKPDQLILHKRIWFTCLSSSTLQIDSAWCIISLFPFEIRDATLKKTTNSSSHLVNSVNVCRNSIRHGGYTVA